MHPFYEPSRRLVAGRGAGAAGLASMAAYLAFWAVALVVARRELDARFPRLSPGRGDPALALARERFARGDIDEPEYRRITAVLAEAARG